ncbi:MAG: hypothetical protein WCA35_11505 [Kovacikia sp.]
MFNQSSRAIATFSRLEEAGQALDQLVISGFPLARVFLVGQDLSACEQNGKAVQLVQIGNSTHPGTMFGTALGLTKGIIFGNIIGGTTGLLLGLGILALPGIGQIALSSAVIFTLMSGGVCTAAGGVIGALVGLGLSEKLARDYSEQISQGNYLLIVNSTKREIACAERILSAQRIRS